MNAKKIIAILLACIVLAINLVFAYLQFGNLSSKGFFSGLEGGKSWSNVSESVIDAGDPNNQIVVISVDDIIQQGSKHDYIMNSLNNVLDSSSVKGLVIRINTPGGGVYESAQIAEKIEEIKLAKHIPVYAAMESIATSGGYYVAAVCDKIYAKEETTTGSIGVIISSTNFSKLFEKYGVTTEVIKSGKFKDIGSSSRLMNAEDRAILQSIVNESYNRFVKVVADGRGMSESEVRTLADGRIYDGAQAYSNKLVDEIGYYDDAIAQMKTAIGVANAEVVSYDYYESFDGLFSLMSTLANNIGKSELQKNLDAVANINNSNQSRPMYLYGGM